MHPKLNLPEFELKFHKENETIFCLSRKKYIVLTPEEWVRQHFLHLLFEHLGYPKGMIKLEQPIRYFKNQKRSDISVISPNGQCFMLVECKSYTVKLDKKTLQQIATYHKVLDAKYLVITNGIKHYIWECKNGNFNALNNFPDYFSN